MSLVSYTDRHAHARSPLQGGTGNRDKLTMGRNDKQKYTGTNKTVSKKDERVGLKKEDPKKKE